GKRARGAGTKIICAAYAQPGLQPGQINRLPRQAIYIVPKNNSSVLVNSTQEVRNTAYRLSCCQQRFHDLLIVRMPERHYRFENKFMKRQTQMRSANVQ